MLERSELAENAINCLHDEQYDVPFNLQNLNHTNMLFMGGREIESLNGHWNFAVDLLDTGLRQRWYDMKPIPAEQRVEPWDYDPYVGETIPVPLAGRCKKRSGTSLRAAPGIPKLGTTKSQSKTSVSFFASVPLNMTVRYS